MNIKDSHPITLPSLWGPPYVFSMNIRSLLVAISLLAAPAMADDAMARWQTTPQEPVEAESIDLGDFKWIARPLIVFADSPLDPAFQDQMILLEREVEELVERDILWIIDTNPDTPSALRRQLRPRGFSLVLIGKDGQIKFRKPLPWDVRELTRLIDKMPMRQREIEEDRAERARAEQP